MAENLSTSFNNDLSNSLRGRLEQSLRLSPYLRKSLDLLQMPLFSLDTFLKNELSVNPLLEEIPESFASDPDTDFQEERRHEEWDENDMENNSDLPEYWSDELPLPGASSEREDHDPLNFIAASPENLRAELLSELYMLNLSEKKQAIGTEIISAIDDDGYLRTPLADLAIVCDADMEEMTQILTLIRNIAPAGVGAFDLAECLKLQLLKSGRLTDGLELLLTEGKDDLAAGRTASLKKRFGFSQDELDTMLSVLRTLNPAPGRSRLQGAKIIVPDLIITREKDGSFAVHTAKTQSMKLQISPYYEKMLDDSTLSSEDRKYLMEKISRSKELLDAVAKRGDTLQQIGEILISRQHGFLEHGTESLKAMTMKSVALELDRHESTVSRAVKEKFVKTPIGVYSLKFFFSGGCKCIGRSDAEEISSQAVKEKIRIMIEEEIWPLTDDEIASELKKAGIKISRRTVAKYRLAMNIPSSSQRSHWNFYHESLR